MYYICSKHVQPSMVHHRRLTIFSSFRFRKRVREIDSGQFTYENIEIGKFHVTTHSEQ